MKSTYCATIRAQVGSAGGPVACTGARACGYPRAFARDRMDAVSNPLHLAKMNITYSDISLMKTILFSYFYSIESQKFGQQRGFLPTENTTATNHGTNSECCGFFEDELSEKDDV